MVHLNSLKCEGLYSFKERFDLDLSNHMIIVGPNNSGKSNIFRILKILIDTFYTRHRLGESIISIGHYNPFLEISLVFSPEETRKIVDFFSFHLDKQNARSVFHQFKNYDYLLTLFNEVIISLSWQREMQRDESEAYVKLEFPKIGLKFFNRRHSDFRVSNKFPKIGEDRKFSNDIKLAEILDQLSEKDSPQETIKKNFEELDAEIDLQTIRIDQNVILSDNAKRILTDLLSFMGLTTSSASDIHLAELLGTIFKKSLQISSGSKGILSKSILEYAEMLKLERKSGMADDESTEFNTILENQAQSKVIAFNEELNSDGSNLISFLFSLKNSPNQSERNRFQKIKEGFDSLFRNELSFDVILQYDFSQKYSVWGGGEIPKPRVPTIMILDKNLNIEFSADQVGIGTLEVIYLLTLAYGREESVVLLDEPTVNLHPALMKSVSSLLQKSDLKNQFMIITHSPELASFEIFERRATVFYVRKKNQTSIIKKLDGEIKEWFDNNRARLKHQIDSRIFYGKSVLLTEGESDRNLLYGIADYLESKDPTIDITGNDVIITSVNGKENFEKYLKLLNSFEIPYVVLADSDAKNQFKNSGTINKDSIQGENSVFVIENGNLEDLMKEIDPNIYDMARKENGRSKPAIAFSFAEKITKSNPEALNPIKSLLQIAVKHAKT